MNSEPAFDLTVLKELATAFAALWILAHVVIAIRRLVIQAATNLFQGRRITDFVFQPVDIDRMPSRAAAHIERFTPEMEAIGFRPIGEYRQLYSPQPAFARYFLGPDCNCFGEILKSGGIETFSFFSVCDDGTYLETAATEVPVGRSEQLRCRGFPGASVDDLYARHQECMRAYSIQHDSWPIELTTEHLEQVANFGRRLARRSHKRAVRREQPDFLVRATSGRSVVDHPWS